MLSVSCEKLNKGFSVELEKVKPNLKEIRVELGWDAGDNFDIDLMTCLLKRKMLSEISDIVSPYEFSEPLKQADGTYKSKCGSVHYLGDNLVGNDSESSGDVCETVIVNLDSLIANRYDGVHFSINLFKALDRQQSFGMIKNAFVRVRDNTTNELLITSDINLSKYALDVALEVGAAVYENGKWRYMNLEINHAEDAGKSIIGKISSKPVACE